MRLARLLRNRVIGIARRMRARVDDVRPAPPRTLTLTAVQRRLELLLSAMFGEPLGDGLLARGPTAQPHARSILLPPSLRDDGDAAERYRLLAIEQGARIVRGTREHLPADPLERDLYAIIEGASIDAELVQRAPGLSRAISAMRREEVARRSNRYVDRLARPVEELLQQVLTADPSAEPPSVPRSPSPQESALAARRLAAELRTSAKKRAYYVSHVAVPMWDHESAGIHIEGLKLPPSADFTITSSKGSSHRVKDNKAETQVTSTETRDQRDDAEVDERSSGNPDATRATSTDTSPADPEAESGAPAQGAAPINAAGAPHPDDVGARDDQLTAVPKGPAPGGIQYPEWIDRFKRMEPRHATVFAARAPEGDGAWARDALRDHAGLMRQLRDRFSMLRARRLRLRAQRSGDELDLDACVNAMVDLHLKRVPSDRLYQTTRASRQPLAITILIDVSGSTRELLPDGQSVLDVERLSVVLASEALASLGDPYSVLAFSGNSRHSVRVATLKEFAEKDLGAMQRRVSALESGDNTRLGAAVRHATSLLLKQSAHRHVLLILSDGRPHDVDWYWADAAVEDSRIALLEARAAGVHSFCITVDSKEADYLPHLFGEGRYWVLSNPAELPKALIRLIDTILTA